MIYVKCDTCGYINGPFTDVYYAYIAVKLHEIARIPTPGEDPKHKCFYVNYQAKLERAEEIRNSPEHSSERDRR